MMRKLNMKKRSAFLWTRLICLLVILAMVTPVITESLPVYASSSIQVRYFRKTVDFKRTQLGVTLDGKSVNMKGTPGLSMVNKKKESVYMVSAADVFRDALGTSYTYSNGNITIKKWNVTIKMTLNSKTAYINGKKMTLAHPPVMVKYIKANKSKVLVPARTVASALGYTYSSTKTSTNYATIKLTTPFYIKYDGTWRKYTRTQAKLTFDGTDVSVSTMPCVVMNEMFYVQAKAFGNSVIGAKYSYKPSQKSVTISYNGNTLQMKLDETTATINGKTANMPASPELTTNGKTNKDYVMVPIAFVAKQLGFSYNSNTSTKTCILKRKDSTYFTWEASGNTEDNVVVSPSPSPTVSPQPDSNETATGSEDAEDGSDIDSSVIEPGNDQEEETPEETVFAKISKIIAQRKSDKDLVTITGSFTKDFAAVEESGSTITVTFTNTKNPIGAKSEELQYPYLLTSVSITDGSDGTTVLTIARKSSSIGYEVEIENGKVVIVLSKQQTTVKNGIKIAVDAGHGAYTAGKRTPKLLASLDFNGDGIIDAAKGTQIREHTANVGVAKYAAAALERCGFMVYRSAFGSTDISLTSRQANIKASKSDYSISIHFNAAGNGTSFNSGQGIEVFSHSNASKAGQSKSLAAAVLKQVINGTKQINRGVNSQHTFAMCNTQAMGTKGSILLECAFMTNWNEVKNMMAKESYWKETGEEVAKGFCNYLGVPYIAEK